MSDKNSGDSSHHVGRSDDLGADLDRLSFFGEDSHHQGRRPRYQKSGETTSQLSPTPLTSLATAVADGRRQDSSNRSQNEKTFESEASVFKESQVTPMGGSIPESARSAPIPNFYRFSKSDIEDTGSGISTGLASINKYSKDRGDSSSISFSSKYKPSRNEATPLLRPTPTPILISYPSPTNGGGSHQSHPPLNGCDGGRDPTKSNQWHVATNGWTLSKNINSAGQSNLRTTLPDIIFRVRLVNLITTTLTILCMIFTLWEKLLDLPQLVLCVYAICFCALLCAYELHIRWQVARLIHDNFGILSSPYGRAFYILFCGTMCLTQGTIPFIFGCILFSNACYNIYLICKYPDYRLCEESFGREDVRDIASGASGIPAWVTALPGSYGSTDSGVKEIVDEEHERLLNAPTLGSKTKANPFTSCLPNKARAADLQDQETG